VYINVSESEDYLKIITRIRVKVKENKRLKEVIVYSSCAIERDPSN